MPPHSVDNPDPHNGQDISRERHYPQYLARAPLPEELPHFYDAILDISSQTSPELKLDDRHGIPQWMVQSEKQSGQFGGAGYVLEGYDQKLRRPVAIKVLHEQGQNDWVAREARALAELDHKNILKVYALAPYGNKLAIVMEWLDPGRSLVLTRLSPLFDQYAQEKFKRALRGDFFPDVTLEFFIRTAKELGSAADYAVLSGRAHFDINPQNIMLTDQGVKLLDFGLAVGVQDSPWGVPGFFPPERSRKTFRKPKHVPTEMSEEERDSTLRGEVYSVGMSLIFLLLGENVFSSVDLDFKIQESQHAFLPFLDDDAKLQLISVLSIAIHRDPTKRYPNATRLVEELQAIFGFSEPLNLR